MAACDVGSRLPCSAWMCSWSRRTRCDTAATGANEGRGSGRRGHLLRKEAVDRARHRRHRRQRSIASQASAAAALPAHAHSKSISSVAPWRSSISGCAPRGRVEPLLVFVPNFADNSGLGCRHVRRGRERGLDHARRAASSHARTRGDRNATATTQLHALAARALGHSGTRREARRLTVRVHRR
eukprot:141041-Chlamydomonas_euryale.AAC.5